MFVLLATVEGSVNDVSVFQEDSDLTCRVTLATESELTILSVVALNVAAPEDFIVTDADLNIALAKGTNVMANAETDMMQNIAVRERKHSTLF